MRGPDPDEPDLDGSRRGVRCDACGDVIGVYEPLVHSAGGFAWHTSRAAEPGIDVASGRRYHLACYEALGEPG